jgi:hypothetical protein
MLVVVADVGREDSFEVSAVDDQEPVEALAADGADPPFDVGVRARRPNRGADCPDPLATEHLVEGCSELAVAVVDQETGRLRAFDERLDEVPGLLGRPLPSRVRGDTGQIHPAGGECDEHECVEATEQHRVDGKEVARDDAAGLRAQEGPPRLRRPTRRGIDPGLLQDRPNGAGGDPDTESCELALDPPVAPAGVLAREPQDQRADIRIGRGPARPPTRMSPTPRDQRAVPATDRLRPHKYASPPLTRK